jgi:glutaredoxin
MAGGDTLTVTVLSRPGCHLCEEAMAELDAHLQARAESGPSIVVEEVDIETDDDLHRRYLERIPVIKVGDRIISEIWFEAGSFDEALEGLTEKPG